MNKKSMIKEIIKPVMDEKGFVLISDKRGIWTWEKEVLGVKEKVNLWDFDGRLSLHIGISRSGIEAVQASSLINTLESPRTDFGDWDYSVSDDKETMYSNILLDYRDILIKNCDEAIQKNAKEISVVMENDSRRFNLLCNQFDELKRLYYDKFHVAEKEIVDVIGEVLDKVIECQGSPLSSVESELVGYAVLLESLLLEKKGVRKKLNYEYQSSVLTDEHGKSVNILSDIFYAWEDIDFMEILRWKIMQFI